MTTVSTAPEQATKAAATERGRRAFIQGLGIDVATALAAFLLVWLPDADLSSRDAWLVFGTGAARTVLGALASYVMRLKVAPSQEAELVEGAYVITDLDTGQRQMTTEAPPLEPIEGERP